MLALWLGHLKEVGGKEIAPETRTRLLQFSAATIDCLLTPAKTAAAEAPGPAQ